MRPTRRPQSDEEELLTQLFTDYHKYARPLVNSSSTVVVTLQFSLMHIKDLVSPLFLRVIWFLSRNQARIDKPFWGGRGKGIFFGARDSVVPHVGFRADRTQYCTVLYYIADCM